MPHVIGRRSQVRWRIDLRWRACSASEPDRLLAFVSVDVRIIAATNRDLGHAVAAGLFRPDLYYRFGSTLHLPPLSEREGDIDLLTDHLLPRLAAELGLHAAIDEDARAVLRRHAWPGNVRELERVLREGLMAANGQVLSAHHLTIRRLSPAAQRALDQADGAFADMTLFEATRRLQKRMVALALRRASGNRKEAARRLGVDVKTLRRRLQD